MTPRRKLVFKASAIAVSALLIIGGVAVTIGLTVNNRAPNVESLRSYRLVFDEEFNGTTLDSSKWSTCYDWYSTLANGCTNDGNQELEWYLRGNVSVNSGNLILKAERIAALGTDLSGVPKVYPYRSGMVSTGSGGSGKPKWSNRYGYYEARVMTPAGRGLWPAFWMLPSGRTWPPEIDIMEQTGDAPKSVLQTYFWPYAPTVSQKDSFTFTADRPLTEGWHTYGLLWREGSLTWYVDSRPTRTVRSANVPTKPMQIVLNLAVGGMLPGPPDDETRFPSVMKVDYVRVYKPA